MNSRNIFIMLPLIIVIMIMTIVLVPLSYNNLHDCTLYYNNLQTLFTILKNYLLLEYIEITYID